MKDETKCIVVISAAFKDGGAESEEYKEYAKRSNANGEAHGGVVLSKYMVEQNLGNGTTPYVVLLVEYPSREKAIETFTNEEYKNIIPLRDAALKEVNILIVKN